MWLRTRPSDFSLSANDADADSRTSVTSCTASTYNEASHVPVSECPLNQQETSLFRDCRVLLLSFIKIPCICRNGKEVLPQLQTVPIATSSLG